MIQVPSIGIYDILAFGLMAEADHTAEQECCV